MIKPEYLKLHSLVLFRPLLEDKTMQRLLCLLDALGNSNTLLPVETYAAFCSALFEQTTCFSDYLLQAMLMLENAYVLKTARGEEIPRELADCLQSELAILQQVSTLTSAQVKRSIPYEGFLPDWQTKQLDLTEAYMGYIARIPTHGYGQYAAHHMFTVSKGIPVPASHPDPVRLSDLYGYMAERQSVISNTMALIEGRPAANALLYGDSGTGKSSTIKAIANEYHTRGLRLVEIRKNQMHHIPSLINRLSQNPLKFILFIDDLSFEQDDDNYTTLKAILEGSVLARTRNIAIYATSNRRHLVREFFSDRGDDDIHANETMQQLISLSDRFGMTVAFTIPGKEQYLQIVSHIAGIYNINLQQGELHRQAEVYALHKGGRSPRIARQFVEHLASLGE